ncbi:MAG: hypothetical protein QM669_07425 [Siphonobacter sp.]
MRTIICHILLLAISFSGYAQAPDKRVTWPIDAKVDSVMEILSKKEIDRKKNQIEALFAPSGYFIVLLPNKSERWVSVNQFLNQINHTSGTRYQLHSAKVIHFEDVKRNEKGMYSSQATIYFDVRHFENHLPVTEHISKVAIPLNYTPPSTDYWQIYELKLIEVNPTVLSTPRR